MENSKEGISKRKEMFETDNNLLTRQLIDLSEKLDEIKNGSKNNDKDKEYIKLLLNGGDRKLIGVKFGDKLGILDLIKTEGVSKIKADIRGNIITDLVFAKSIIGETETQTQTQTQTEIDGVLNKLLEPSIESKEEVDLVIDRLKNPDNYGGSELAITGIYDKLLESNSKDFLESMDLKQQRDIRDFIKEKEGLSSVSEILNGSIKLKETNETHINNLIDFWTKIHNSKSNKIGVRNNDELVYKISATIKKDRKGDKHIIESKKFVNAETEKTIMEVQKDTGNIWINGVILDTKNQEQMDNFNSILKKRNVQYNKATQQWASNAQIENSKTDKWLINELMNA